MKLGDSFRLRGIRIVAVFLCSFVCAPFAQAAIHVGNMQADRILFLGNSLTHVPPTPEIGWTGDWGMAASAQDKGYAHLVSNAVAGLNSGNQPAMQAVNIVSYGGWEQNFGPDYDVQTQLKTLLDWKANIVVVELGDNVSGSLASNAARSSFAKSFKEVLTAFKNSSQPKLFVLSTWFGTLWPTAGTDGILQQACDDVGGVFVNISDVYPNPVNQGGWGGHPSDAGMAAIADRVFGTMVAHSVPEPNIVTLLACGTMATVAYGWRKRRER